MNTLKSYFSHAKILALLSCILFTILFLDTNKALAENVLPEKPMVIVIPSYNNLQWLESNLNSVWTQKYNNYRIIYIDDCSGDGTGAAVERFFAVRRQEYRVINFDDSFSNDIVEVANELNRLINKEQHYFTIVRNVNRCGALANLYRGICSCKNQEIIVALDGDDWLYHDRVLEKLNKTYTKNDIWFTHGCLIEYPWGNVTWSEAVPEWIIEKSAYREYKCPSHLRTFYAGLFKKIKLEDLLYQGKFFPMAWDMAIMFPLAEMAGERHAYTADVSYSYNMSNQINDNKVDPGLQNELDYFIRHKTPYKRLEKANFLEEESIFTHSECD